MFSIIFLIVLLLALIFLSIPIPFAITLTSLFFVTRSDFMTTFVLLQRTYAGVNKFLLLAVPLFLMTGIIMNETGITDKLINFASTLVGRFKGGLAHVNILTSMFFAGISGSSNADTAGIGSLLIPAMIKRGYSKEFSVVVTAASSTLGNVIPPSIIAIIYASAAGISVGALFLAGVIPGIMIALGQMFISYIYAIKYGYGEEKKNSIKEIFIAFKESFLPLLTPIIILYGIFGGLFTATEAAVIAATYSLFLGGLVYRTLTLKKIIVILETTVKLTFPILFCIATTETLGYVMAILNMSEIIRNILEIYINSPLAYFGFTFVLLLIIGTFMGAAPAILILVPVISPIAISYGINPIHYGIVCVALFALGLITPPYGVSLLLACSIANISVGRVLRVLVIFLIMAILIISFCVLFPDIILSIPRIIAPRLMPK